MMKRMIRRAAVVALLLAMVASGCLLVLISTICFMKGTV